MYTVGNGRLTYKSSLPRKMSARARWMTPRTKDRRSSPCEQVRERRVYAAILGRIRGCPEENTQASIPGESMNLGRRWRSAAGTGERRLGLSPQPLCIGSLVSVLDLVG